MRTLYLFPLRTILLIHIIMIMSGAVAAQPCTPQGDQTTYGTNNVWIAYVYQGINFNRYKGYVNEGVAGNSNFDESFGGTSVTYNTNGCSIKTDTFSVRYKLTQTFADGDYNFEAGGDDGYRFSLDGGSTWVINNWGDHSYTSTTYTVHLNGTYNMVLEYYENFIDNRVTFKVSTACIGNGDPAAYGASSWTGYMYQGMNFNTYKGFVSEGSAVNPNFDESFGGTNVTYNTSNCSIQTEKFSARYRLRKFLAAGTYIITVGGDDGYRLSLDGGATWVINKWVDQSYGVTTYTGNLNGTYDLVLEYYENGGGNRISFNMTANLLPVKIIDWSGMVVANNKAQLKWVCENAMNFDHFTVQRSNDAIQCTDIRIINTNNSNYSGIQSCADREPLNGSEKVFYRLQMVDKDGSSTYSNIISLSPKSTMETRMYPTMVESGNLFVESGKTWTHSKLDIYDMSGRNLFSKDLGVLNGRRQVNIENGGSMTLAAGSYIAVLSDGMDILAKKIIIIK